jgi:hypothetical protein
MGAGARRAVVGALLVTALVGLDISAALANGAVKPNQHFSGLVNGSHATPVVYTVCPGPASSGRTGPVAGNQKMSVARAGKGKGYTGPFSQIYGWFVQDSSGIPPQTLTFTQYGVSQAIPSAARVPCDGRGQAQFSSCPYLAPCAFGFVPDLVEVRFVNIAA